VPYCQKAPRNQELNGLFQCQFQGADPTQFTRGLKAGAPGTIPLGQKNVLNPAGSCPAHTSGPIADGTQLVDQVSSPGVPSGDGAGNSNAKNPSSVPPKSSTPPAPAASAPTQSPAPPSTGSKGFAFQNGQDAQSLNQKFQTLTEASACNGNVIWCAKKYLC